MRLKIQVSFGQNINCMKASVKAANIQSYSFVYKSSHKVVYMYDVVYFIQPVWQTSAVTPPPQAR